MYVITFYSFKGGVGRTMALVNVAAELARRGRKVLVVDFDLEAPGLETYKHLQPTKPHPGIVEYVTEYRRTNAVPNLLDYIYETKPIGKRGGRLCVMPAGRRDSAYRTALANLDWQRLYKEEDGFLLFEDTKAGWEQELKPDYVLIDSRTGDTDVLGICTRQLPDSVVLMFTPNEQNLAGLENVVRDIRREETEGLKKKIRLHFVVANVPDLDDYRGILRQQLQRFRERLEFRDLSGEIWRYENLSLLDQSIFVLDRPHTKLAKSYNRLRRTLQMDNLADREGAMLFLKRCQKQIRARFDGYRTEEPEQDNGEPYVKKGRLRVSVGVDILRDRSRWHAILQPLCDEARMRLDEQKRLFEIEGHFKNDIGILNTLANCFIVREDYRSAIHTLNLVLGLDKNMADSVFQRALCKINLFEVDEAARDLLDCLRVVGTERGTPSDQPALSFPRRLRLQQACLERLCAMQPEKLVKLADMVASQEIKEIDLEVVTAYLCRRDEGLPLAARLLRNYITGLDETESIGDGWALLGARCWREIIELHDAGRIKEEGARSMLCLALAHWGENGEMPVSLCRQALESEDRLLDSWAFEARSWLLWRVGKVTDAIEWLDQAEERARDEVDDVFSLWQLRKVSAEQFLNDCRSFRHMLQGEPVRPAFLSPLPANALA